MRVLTSTPRIDTAPGGDVDVVVDVVNTSHVIDGVTARVIGLDPDQVTSTPGLLPLFPDSTGSLTLSVHVPQTFPAGRHPLTVEVASSIPTQRSEHLDLDLVVTPRPRVKARLQPSVRRSRRRGHYLVECLNTGNVPLTLALTADEPERTMRCAFSPPVLTVEAGTTGSSLLTIKAKRRLFGSDLDRPVRVEVVSEEHGVDDSVVAVLRQRPLIPRGLLTVAVLLCILGLWAGSFLLGLSKVFDGDPLTKSAPASFFLTAGDPDGMKRVASSLPGDVLAKGGTLPPGVGGGLSGTVTASSTGAGAARIVIEALRPTRDGLVLVASAATQADGSYTLLGLLPGGYYLRFSAPGYETSFYPSAGSQSGATTVPVRAGRIRARVDSNVVGLPASITGRVDPGETLSRPTTVVTARSLHSASTSPVASARTDADGRFVLPRLPAPGTYELGFTTPGYAPTTILSKVGGGQARSEPTVRLSAGDGSISGQVLQVDGSGAKAPLGAVTVTTTVEGQPATTATPTTGQVGRFSLTGLPTPGTYVLTFARPGFGATTRSVDLLPGQSSTLEVELRSGTGTVEGVVLDGAGADDVGLGGVTVTVGGTSTPLTTTTLTNGSVGSYALSGLAVPGSYTLTFSRPGYEPQTVPVRLDARAPAAKADATLTPGTGQLTGRVLGADGAPVAGATIAVSDGSEVRETTTVSTGAGGPGSYRVTGLAPGTWTVTVSGPGLRQQTALVTVAAARATCQNLRAVPATAPDPGDPVPCA